jgi:hypothetical protein
VFDKDQDGYISRAELKACFETNHEVTFLDLTNLKFAHTPKPTLIALVKLS